MTISIITPSFNQLDWLRLCVVSVCDQAVTGDGMLDANPKSKIQNLEFTLPFCIEHIIQDAGTPGIENFAREVGADFHRDGKLVFPGIHGGAAPAPSGDSKSKIQNPSSRYCLAIHCERDGGMYDAVNRGFEKANGDLLAYLNCDEQYLPGALEAVTHRFGEEPDLGMLFADAVVVEGDGAFLCFRKAQVPFRDQLWFRMPVLSCATFLRKTVFAQSGVRLDETKKVLGDVIWIMRAQEKRIRMGVLRRFTSVFTETEANLGVGGTADREFLELRARMPRHVARGMRIYEAWHKIRSLLSGTRHAAPFSYEIYTAFDTSAKKSFFVASPTAVWKGRTEIDKKVLGAPQA